MYPARPIARPLSPLKHNAQFAYARADSEEGRHAPGVDALATPDGRRRSHVASTGVVVFPFQGPVGGEGVDRSREPVRVGAEVDRSVPPEGEGRGVTTGARPPLQRP